MTGDFDALAALFGTSLALGLLVGLERERHPGAKAGVRTFALIALAGTLAAMVGERAGTPLVTVAVVVLVAVLVAAAYLMDPSAVAADAGTTSVVAAMVVALLGAAVWYGASEIAAAVAIVTTLLLFFKPEIERFSTRLAPRDVTGTLQVAVLSFVILPLAPDEGYGPYRALNPHHIWLMVVLVAALSWAGYVAWRLAPGRRGLTTAGLLGGLVSTTATTLVFSRHARAQPALARTAASAILLANLIPPLRLAAIVGAAAPALVVTLAPVIGAYFAGALPAAIGGLVAARRSPPAANEAAVDFTNPANFNTAIGFGVAYAAILVVSAWLADVAGGRGVIAAAAAAGLVDVDAIALSTARLATTDALGAVDASRAIGAALVANAMVKQGIAFSVGGGALARRVALGFAPAALATIAAIVAL